jgi:hypothetical protein
MIEKISVALIQKLLVQKFEKWRYNIVQKSQEKTDEQRTTNLKNRLTY